MLQFIDLQKFVYRL